MLERLPHQLEPELERRPSVARELLEESRIVRGLHHDEDIAEVLRGGTNETRSADVDLLDQIVERGLGSGCGPGKRIQIHDHEVDGLNTLKGQRI